MKYSLAIMAATVVFLIVGYVVYTKSHTPSAPHSNSDESAFAENLDFAADLATALGLPASQTSTATPSSRALPAGTKEYQNAQYGFSFLYPSDLKVSTFDEGGGAVTILFQNIVDAKGFQIFIVPYQEKRISMARFHADEPSGVMERPVNILIGGTAATMFFSNDATLGDTIEVWSIKNGHLFEITAPKSLDVWLANIMQTWKFL